MSNTKVSVFFFFGEKWGLRQGFQADLKPMKILLPQPPAAKGHRVKLPKYRLYKNHYMLPLLGPPTKNSKPCQCLPETAASSLHTWASSHCHPHSPSSEISNSPPNSPNSWLSNRLLLRKCQHMSDCVPVPRDGCELLPLPATPHCDHKAYEIDIPTIF